MPSISPLLSVDDIGKSLDYYEKVLGFRRGLTLPGDDGKLTHGEAHTGDLMVMFGPAQHPENVAAAKLAQGAAKGVGVLLYFDLGEQDIDKYYKDVKGAGAKIIEAVQDQFWGDRNFTVEDPDGYILTFSKHVKDVDFSQMEPPERPLLRAALLRHAGPPQGRDVPHRRLTGQATGDRGTDFQLRVPASGALMGAPWPRHAASPG